MVDWYWVLIAVAAGQWVGATLSDWGWRRVIESKSSSGFRLACNRALYTIHKERDFNVKP